MCKCKLFVTYGNIVYSTKYRYLVAKAAVDICLDTILKKMKQTANYLFSITMAWFVLMNASEAFGQDASPRWEVLNEEAIGFYNAGEMDRAHLFATKALEAAEKDLGPHHIELAAITSNLAYIYDAQGLYTKAEPLYKRSLAITEKVMGLEHPEVAVSLDNLGYNYEAQGRYQEAESVYKRSLAIIEKALGPDHLEVSLSLNTLAEFYQTLGQYQEAEAFYKRILRILEKSLGPKHLTVAACLESLASVYRATNRNGEAEILEQRAANIRTGQ